VPASNDKSVPASSDQVVSIKYSTCVIFVAELVAKPTTLKEELA